MRPSLNRQEWDVVWIHLSRWAPAICVAFGGNKSWAVEDLSTFQLPRIVQRKMFVCMDRLIAEQTHVAFVKRVLPTLRYDDRLVTCSSLATFRERNDEDDDLAKIQPYFMYSWTQEEYLAAIRNPVFYGTVKDKFDTTSNFEVNDECDDDEILSEEDTKTEALRLKLYYAGGSCRFMFQYTTEKVKSILNRAIRSSANKAELIKYCGGAFPGDSISKLYGMQRGSPDGERFPVSRCVASLVVNLAASLWSSRR